MYTVIKKFKTDAVDKSIEYARDSFLPLVSKLPGFMSYNFIKAGDNMAVSILYFNSKAEAEASTETSKKWIADNGFDSLYQLEEMIEGELVVKSW